MNKISFKEPGILLLGLILSILSAAICMQIMGQFGIVPNTSLISAVLVMIVAWIPLSVAMRFKNVHRQNLVLSIASSYGFAAANCGFISIATVFILRRNDLIIPIPIIILAFIYFCFGNHSSNTCRHCINALGVIIKNPLMHRICI